MIRDTSFTAAGFAKPLKRLSIEDEAMSDEKQNRIAYDPQRRCIVEWDGENWITVFKGQGMLAEDESIDGRLRRMEIKLDAILDHLQVMVGR